MRPWWEVPCYIVLGLVTLALGQALVRLAWALFYCPSNAVDLGFLPSF